VKKSTWFWFSLMRLAAFALPLAIMLLLGMTPWLAAVLSAIIGLCVSYIFFAKTRNALSESLYEKRAAKAVNSDKDADAEDAEVEAGLAKESKGKA
jgi:membrane protein implicated in regulation of membrane protease activity